MSGGMRNRDRLIVYAAGVLLGLVLLGFLQRQRQDADGEPKRFLHGVFQRWVDESGLRNLPDGSPEYLRRSRLRAYLTTRPDEEGRFEYIWILDVEEGHPRVRVVEALRIDLEAERVRSEGYAVMAADQLLVALQPGADLEAFDDLLAGRGMARLEFLAGPQMWLVELGQGDVLTVPSAAVALERHGELVREARPRFITWR